MTQRFSPDEAQDFAASVVEFSERISAKRDRLRDLKEKYKLAKQDLDTEIEAEQKFIRDFKPGRFPLLDNTEQSGNGRAERVPPAKPEKPEKNKRRGTDAKAEPESVPPDASDAWRTRSASTLDVSPELAQVLKNAGLKTLGDVADWYEGQGGSILFYDELAQLAEAIGLASQAPPATEETKPDGAPASETGEPVGHSTRKAQSVPAGSQSKGRQKRFDVWHSYGVPSPVLLATIEASSITSAWQHVHSHVFRDPLGRIVPTNQLDVRHATADIRRRQEKAAVGRNELAAELERQGAAAQSRVESQTPDALPTRPRGRKARRTEAAAP